MGQFRQYPALADRLRAVGIECQNRDVVQSGLERQEKVLDGRALSDFLQLVQRNRLFLAERAGLDAPEISDVTQRAKRACDVPCQRPDVCPLGNMRDQRDAVRQFERRLRIVGVGPPGSGLECADEASTTIVTPAKAGVQPSFRPAAQVDGSLPSQE